MDSARLSAVKSSPMMETINMVSIDFGRVLVYDVEEEELKWKLYRISLQGSFSNHISRWLSVHFLFHVQTSHHATSACPSDQL